MKNYQKVKILMLPLSMKRVSKIIYLEVMR